MSELKNISLVLVLLTLGSACSSRSSENHASSNALPATWYSLPEAKNTQVNNIKSFPSEEVLVQPTQEADASVENIFKAYTSSFSELASPPIEKTMDLSAEQSSKVPWHLDGLIADFAVSTDGLLGARLFNGTFAFRTAWKKQNATSSANNSKSQQKKSILTIGAKTSSKDVSEQLEPTIRSTMAAGLVQPQYESAFRANLLKEGEKFRNFCQSLSSIDTTGFASTWKVNGFQLQLTFTAGGDVTPVTNVSGAFNLFFDWQKSEGDAPATEATAQSKKLSEFTHLISDEIFNALLESPEVKDLGLNLQSFQIGVGMSAAGDVGVAQASAGVQGKIVFKKQVTKEDKGEAQNIIVASGQEDGVVNLIGTTEQPEQIAYAKSIGTPFKRLKNGIVYRIQRHKFRRGLKRALKMTSYFGKKAIAADTEKWKLNEIETELDISLGGEFAIATVTGVGQVVLDFDRAE